MHYLTSTAKNVDDLEERLREAEDMEEEEHIKSELLLDIGLEDIQLADQYQALGLLSQDEDNILPTIEFDDAVEDQDSEEIVSAVTEPSGAPNTMLPSQLHQVPQDLSEELPHQQVQDKDPEPFTLALSLWYEEADISRTQYSSLREILRMLEPNPILNRLLNSYAPLQRKTKGWLPQLQLRRDLLSLTASKMPSLAEKQKKHTTGGAPKEHLYFFDPVDLFAQIL